jgi:hypothetical protein
MNTVWGNLFGTDTFVGVTVIDLRESTASKLGFSASSFFAVSHQYDKHHLFWHLNRSSIAMGGTDIQVCSGFVEVWGLITFHGSWSSLVSLLSVSKSVFALIVLNSTAGWTQKHGGMVNQQCACNEWIITSQLFLWPCVHKVALILTWTKNLKIAVPVH